MEYKNKIIQKDMSEIDDELFINKLNKNMKVMITGCNGMIASYLVYYFMHLNDKYSLNIKVYGVTRSIDKSKNKFKDLLDRDDFVLLNHDVNNKFDFKLDIDYLFHLASSADPVNILNRPTDIIRANTIGTFNVLDFAYENKVKKVIFSSTREVYGKVDDDVEWVNEESLGVLDQMSIRACYPESKKIGETIINSYNLQFGVPYTILRIAHSYGPGMPVSNDGRIMSDLINNVLNNEDIVLKSDGCAIRGFCYLTDLISGIMFATFVGEDNNIYNIANEDENISIKDLALKLTELFPLKKLSVSYKKMSEKDREGYCKFKRVKMDTLKLRKLGWKPKMSLNNGLTNTVNFFEGER